MKAFVCVTIMLVALILVLKSVLLSGSRKESSRKIVHIVMGTLCLSFPWIFQSALPVTVLAILVAITLCILRQKNSPLVQEVLFTVKRRSFGELLYPFSVALIFYLAQADLVSYLVPIAVLAYGDSAAALIGERFGKNYFRLEHGKKSLEGSLAFFATSFIASALIMIGGNIAGGAGAAQQYLASILLSLMIACVATVIEAICFAGLDNLFVPLSVFTVLQTTLGKPMQSLVLELSVLVLCTVVVLYLKGQTTLKDGAAGLGLSYSYIALVTGGVPFIVIPVLLLAVYPLLLPRRFRVAAPVHGDAAIYSVVFAGLVFLALVGHFSLPTILSAYSLAFALHGSIIASAHIHFDGARKEKLFLVTLNAFKSWALLYLPLACLVSSQINIVQLVLSPLFVIIPSLFYLVSVRRGDVTNSGERWLKQSALASFGSLCFFCFVL